MGLEDAAKDVSQDALRELTVSTHAKMVELAQDALHTRRKTFLDGLKIFQADDNTWVISLDASARWTIDGIKQHEMIDDLLKKGKRSADGSVYKVIPFRLNKQKQQMTAAQQSLLATVKKELAKVGTTPNQIEMNAQGQPKLGLVRSLDINTKPKSTRALRIGGGPYGDVAQGSTGGIPLLRGVRVYQEKIKDKDGGEKVGRFVATFRVVSSKQKGSGKWIYPGLDPVDIFEQSMEWAQTTWEQKVAPKILAKLIASIS
jgi:hypothetical protein